MIEFSGEQENGLGLQLFTQWIDECEQQPAWRSRADRECEYYDGNQLDSDVMRRAQERGLPPAIEPLIGPAIDSVLGAEAKTRTDWRVIADSDKEGEDVAEALNYRLNQAERHSKADAACSEAYAGQVKVGIGWVEVAREQDPFSYAYRCSAIHRNEIWFDWLAKSDMSDARYLVRRRWMERDKAALMFPDKADLIDHAGSGWQRIDPGLLGMDGGTSTDLAMAQNQERGWSIEEMQWRDIYNNRVCLFEVWYRNWQRALVIKSPDGRVIEYDAANPMHVDAVASKMVDIQWSVIGKVRLAWFMGPHRLADIASPYKHNKFPYVPFWGKREDRTGVPYGLIRGSIYLQDEVNARIARMQWGLAASRTTRTDGAVLDDDETFRDEVARPDADIVLDAEAMRQGGVFKVERDFELNRQQYERLVDAREGIKRTAGIYNAFMGQDGQAQSGVAISGLVEQSNQSLADINDNFKESRQNVGDLLLSLIIEDMTGKEETVFIDGKSLKDDRTVRLNVPQIDSATGVKYLDNDVSRTKLKVTLADVPSTPSFRAQQLSAMSEAFKSAPKEYQKVMMPHLFNLLDVPNKQDIVAAIKQLDEVPTPEEIEQRIQAAVQQALEKAAYDLKMHELEQKQPLIDAQVKNFIAQSVAKNIEGFYSATNTAATVATNPNLAVAADIILKSAGAVDHDSAPMIPEVQESSPIGMPSSNTSPMFPPRIPSPAVGDDSGIEAGEKI